MNTSPAEKEPRFCVIIPVYRHEKPLLQVLKRLDSYGLPCLVVDDGNRPPLKETISADLARHPWVEILQLPAHGGKGAATLAGCLRAMERGFTHGLFLDADDQHNAEDIPRMIELARRHLQAMILTRPLFDESAPASRRIGRWVSNIWVWIETWSFQIKDSLCGFRCLPLKPVLALASRVRLGHRLDFDPDLLVRLYWEGLPVVSFDTHIRYPANGHSNFCLGRDNVALSWLHTRLFFGMLRQTPTLLRKAWNGR